MGRNHLNQRLDTPGNGKQTQHAHCIKQSLCNHLQILSAFPFSRSLKLFLKLSGFVGYSVAILPGLAL